jgi:DNA (cytosine-5)-methyltransferase 1
VKLVRGPFLKLPPHAGSFRTPEGVGELVEQLRRQNPGIRLAADLFSGAGGLSLGLEDAGFKVVVSVDHLAEAVETHQHHFAGLSVDWDLSDADRVEELAALIRTNCIDLVTGGPPCQPFSKAGRSMIKYRVHNGLRDPHDQRRDLWRSFVEVVRLAQPRAVVMENVPDMALDKEMFILRTMVEELESLGYSVEERVIDTWRYGVPQFRQRLILVALSDGTLFQWPEESENRVSVWNAIGDMFEVEGGWRPEGGAAGWIDYAGPRTSFQEKMRSRVAPDDRDKLYDHITRPVRSDDVVAFEAMDSSTKYSDLPDNVKRYRDDIFDDKYKRLNENDLSRTITAHIAKDGYWYIHPRQNRTLTVREAARLQTFPDNYRFAGPPSAAFKQIGNAVPPFLATELGKAVGEALEKTQTARFSTRDVASLVSGWFERRRTNDRNMALPWLNASARWQVICAETLLERSEPDQVKALWPLIRSWPEPKATLSQTEALKGIGTATGRRHRVDKLLSMAERLASEADILNQPELSAASVPGLVESVADLATLVVPHRVHGELSPTEEGKVAPETGEPVLVTKGVLRVASRFSGDPVDKRNKLTDGRMAVARMIGGGSEARSAHLGLIELATAVCRPVDPRCSDCPLASTCASSQAEAQRDGYLFQSPL